MASSPVFILRPSDTKEIFEEKVSRTHPIIFIATRDNQIVAYLRAERDGETFIGNAADYIHVMGAYCLPEHRGAGMHQKLLSLMVHKLKTQGYTRFGVDFESINPVAYAFWLKYFDAYTHSVVRRIDEHAIMKLA
jgi:GNAT superfamily N-acetyltransferase